MNTRYIYRKINNLKSSNCMLTAETIYTVETAEGVLLSIPATHCPLGYRVYFGLGPGLNDNNVVNFTSNSFGCEWSWRHNIIMCVPYLCPSES